MILMFFYLLIYLIIKVNYSKTINQNNIIFKRIGLGAEFIQEISIL
jgi:hypothetical protein